MSTPASVAHPFDIGLAVPKPQLEHTMSQKSPGASAPVIPLPTAVATPIVQVRRAGRYPKNVMPIWKIRTIRQDRWVHQQALLQEIAKIESGIKSCAKFVAYGEARKYEVAVLKQQLQQLQGRKVFA
jgi:hypothetical protein